MRDLSVRIEPVILELERQTADVLIVASEVVLRCIWAYYQEMEPHVRSIDSFYTHFTDNALFSHRGFRT